MCYIKGFVWLCLIGFWTQTSSLKHSSQNWTGPGGRTVKTENQDENRFFKYKEPDICGNFVNP